MRLLDVLILWPKRVSVHFEWLGPLLARMVVGFPFMQTGWGKLNHLERVTEFFTSLGIPLPHLLTPLVSGWEFVGGIMLMLGLMTRINGGALAVIMVVATIAAQGSEIHSLGDLLRLEEILYFALFTWLAIYGAGKVSVDHILERRYAHKA